MKDIPVPASIAAPPPEIFPGLFLQVAARMAQQQDVSACRNAEIKPPFMAVLHTIRSYPGIRQGICAENLGFDATTFGRYIDRLVRDGYLSRSVPPEDRRAVSLTLTEKGVAALDICTPVLAEMERDARDRMGHGEWDLLTALLVRFLEANDHPLPNLARGRKVAAD